MSSRAGRRRVRFRSATTKAKGLSVAELTEASIPRLATGCRWGGTTEAPVVLFPEGAIKVEGTGRAILELCAGQLSLAEIVGKLEQQFILAPPGKEIGRASCRERG